ncbi:MAG TPA: hypothetical protein VN132_03650 [Bdellovibrio sp.]|nr:hypothetical protein [Bdellovibrio sp.]
MRVSATILALLFISLSVHAADSITVNCNSNEMPVPVTVTNGDQASTVIQCTSAICEIQALHTVSKRADAEGIRHIVVFRTAGANKEELFRFDSKNATDAIVLAQQFVGLRKCDGVRVLPDEP